MVETVCAALCFGLLSQAISAATAAISTDQQAHPSTPAPPSAVARDWHVGAFVDGAYIEDYNSATNHVFRNRGTTPRVDEFDLNMAAAYVRKTASDTSRWGMELTTQAGQDSKTFGFSPTAPTIAGAG